MQVSKTLVLILLCSCTLARLPKVYAANSAPIISGSPSLEVVLPTPAALSDLVTDDGLPVGSSVASTWSKVSGPGTVTFANRTAAVTDATFSAPGMYTVRLTATDGERTNYLDTAVSVLASPFTLQILNSGTGSGSVSVAGTTYAGNCSRTFGSATSVTLTATPASGSVFIGWAGTAYSGTNNPCTVLVDSTKTLAAFFDSVGTGTEVYCVATNGSDSHPGTLAQPWRTIQKAASSATAGSKVIVKAGEYNEFVTISTSGTANNPVLFEGERGPNGDWLTIIDPSTPLTNGWVLAPEIGFGVWKQTNLPFATRELTIDHKRVAFVYTNGNMPAVASAAYYNPGLTEGSQFLALAPDAQLMTGMSHKSIRFWDSLEALYGTTNDPTHTTYLRLRSGGDPNGLNIRVAPNKNEYVIGYLFQPIVKLENQSYVVFRNFMLRGGFGCVLITGATAHHNTVENNYLSGGYGRVAVADLAHDNLVRNNEMTGNYFGYSDPGAWTGGVEYRFALRENLYCLSKFLMGNTSMFDEDVSLSNAGDANIVSGNHMFRGLGNGVNVYGSIASPTRKTVICDNRIENEPSVGIIPQHGQTQTAISSNVVSDCNCNLRFHRMDTPGETNRVVYVYANRLWLLDGVGDHIYAHYYGAATGYFPQFWVYHNSFSGGRAGLNVSTYAEAAGGLRGTRFLNNIFSGAQYVLSTSGFWTTGGMLGVFDHNLLAGPPVTYPSSRDPEWLGANNVKQISPEWANAPGMTFALSSGSAAINNALDVTRSFVVQGRTYSALPMAGDKRGGSAWDIGALEYVSSVPPPGRFHIIDTNSPSPLPTSGR